MSQERPQWQTLAQEKVSAWGTKTPLSFKQIQIPLYDSNGRPHIEKPSYNIAEVPFVFKPGLQDGGRQNSIVNISAYVDIVQNIPEIHGLFSYIRDTVHPYKKKNTREALATTINAVAGLPLWLVLKADNPIQNGELPPYITGAAKAARGLSTPFDLFEVAKLYDSIGSRSPKPAVDTMTQSKAFVETVYENKFLLSDWQEGSTACPAPKVEIERLTRVLFEEPTDLKNDAGQKLDLTPDELKRVIKFGNAFSRASIEQEFFNQECNDPDLSSLFGTQEIIILNGDFGPSKAIKEHHIRRMNNLNRWMNEALGRDNPPKITLETLEIPRR